jgi:hypothetical protein
MIWIGWNPTPLLDRMEPSVQVVLERLDEATLEDQARVEDEANEPQVVDGGQE